jgi:hypothetical protein
LDVVSGECAAERRAASASLPDGRDGRQGGRPPRLIIESVILALRPAAILAASQDRPSRSQIRHAVLLQDCDHAGGDHGVSARRKRDRFPCLRNAGVDEMQPCVSQLLNNAAVWWRVSRHLSDPRRQPFGALAVRTQPQRPACTQHPAAHPSFRQWSRRRRRSSPNRRRSAPAHSRWPLPGSGPTGTWR